MALSERDRAILEFERSWWTVPGSKKSRIRRRFGISTSRYYELLSSIVLSDEALAHDPLLVRRLRRTRDDRRRERFEGRSSRRRPSP